MDSRVDPSRLPSRPGAFGEFIRLEASGGLLLLLAAVVAFAWANSPWAGLYVAARDTKVTLGWGGAALSKTAVHWVNDGLMAVFFFVVGLEIKRELIAGELAAPRKAALPIAAAAGGMLVPAAIYAGFNGGTETASGWGVPMATDIAFALAVLATLGDRVPASLKVFLAALAIVDDLGAILVIAVFYSHGVAWPWLGTGVALLAGCAVMNLVGVRRSLAYVLPGIAIWLVFYESGVHATVAGVLLAMTIPARRTNREREAAGERAPAPLQRLERQLHPWVTYLILPLFAFANAGVAVHGSMASSVVGPLGLGIALGLVLGKQLGILGFSWLSVRTGIATLPADLDWRSVYGAAWLAGIGFTMSLFIAGLAFEDGPVLAAAKLAILLGSLVSGCVGWTLLRRGTAGA